MTGRTVRPRRAALLLLASLALLPPAPAAAQAPDPTPSARELHDEYPLRSSVQTPVSQVVEPTPSATAEPQSSRADLQRGTAAVLVILAFGVGFALAFRSRRWRQRGQPVPAAPAPHAWSAEIEWRATDGGARFHVIARQDEGDETLAVAESAPLEWPPKSAEAVSAMTAAADDLESRLVAAGWTPLAPGDAWYARRFAWADGARAPTRLGRFERRAAASGRSDALWRDAARELTVAGPSKKEDAWTHE